jgi:hypothetical protein
MREIFQRYLQRTGGLVISAPEQIQRHSFAAKDAGGMVRCHHATAIGTGLGPDLVGFAIRHTVPQVNLRDDFGQIVIGVAMLLFKQRPQGLSDEQQAIDILPHEFNVGLRLAGIPFRGIGTDLGQGRLHTIEIPVGE